MEKVIREMLSGEDLNLDPSRDSKLKEYVTAKAQKELKGRNGYLTDETVLDWSRHFYLEDQEDIDKEVKELTKKNNGVKNVSNVKKETKPQPQKVKTYNDKGKVVTAVQGSLFDELLQE